MRESKLRLALPPAPDLRSHPQLDIILQPVRKVNDIDRMSADQYRVYNDKLDRDAGKKPPRSARAERDIESTYAEFIKQADVLFNQ